MTMGDSFDPVEPTEVTEIVEEELGEIRVLVDRLAELRRHDRDSSHDLQAERNQALARVAEMDSERADLERANDELGSKLVEADEARAEMEVHLANLSGRLQTVADELRAEQEAAASNLELTQVRLGSTRSALDEAHQSVAEELDLVEQVVAVSAESVASMDSAIGAVLNSTVDVDPQESPPARTAATYANAIPPESEPVVGRTAIRLPPQLEGDDYGTARYLVSIPDVVLLIDGDAVSSTGWPGLSEKQRRGVLVTYLNRLTAEVGTAADVVFFGSVTHADDFDVPKTVRVRISDETMALSLLLADIVDGYPEEWPIVVVTDDAEVERAVGARAASRMSSLQLLDVLQDLYEQPSD